MIQNSISGEDCNYLSKDSVLEALKNTLPNISDEIGLKASGGELKGPCLFCGGEDRFWVSADGKGHCRQCTPGNITNYSKIDFFCKKHGFSEWWQLIDIYLGDISNYSRERQQPVLTLKAEPKPPPSFLDEWNNKCSTLVPGLIRQLFCDTRKLDPAMVDNLIRAGKVKTSTKHGVKCVAVPFVTLQGDDVHAIQYLTVDSKPFHFTIQNRRPVNKVFGGGHKPGAECFFIAGNNIQTAKNLLFSEGVIDALTGAECFPDACCIALGGSTYTKKLSALKPYITHIKKIIVCGDHDKASEDMIQAIYQALVVGEPTNRLCAISFLSSDPRGHDINDLLKAGQKDRIIKMVENAGVVIPLQEKEIAKEKTQITWEDVVSIENTEPSKFNPLSFPGVIGEVALAISEDTETPFEMAAGLILSVLATSCQGRFMIEVKEGYWEPLNLWVLAVLESANRKSSVHATCTRPLIRWESEKRNTMEPEISEAESIRSLQDSRLKSLRAKYGKAKPNKLSEIREEILALELDLEPIPRSPQIWSQDVTPEHLGTLMGLNNERMAVFSAEGGIFDIIGGRYSSGIPNLDLFLQGHAGDPVRVNRGSREPVNLEKPCLSLGLSPQPDVLKGMASKPGFSGRGLLARSLYLLPRSNLGYRTLDTKPVSKKLYAQYERIIHSLLDIVPPENEKGESCPYLLKLSSKAYQEWANFYHVIEKGLRDGGQFEFIKSWAGKLPGAAARIAGVLHCAENIDQPWTKNVSLETMQNALDIAAIFSNHALIAFDLMGADEGMDKARRVWGWIQRKGYSSFKKRDCFNALRGTFPRMADIEEPFKILVERNYIREQVIDTGGRPSIKCYVNPSLIEGE